MPFIDIPTGFTGFTIDVFGGSVSDSEGDVTKVLFAITFQERVNPVRFSITNANDHWSAMMPTGEYIGLSNPKVVFVNRDSAIVQFDMAEKYPSNTLAILAMRNTAADYNVQEQDTEPAFKKNTITSAMGFTSNEYGGGTNDEGEVERIVFNVKFATRRNEVEFTITEEDNDWACLMGDGSYIKLRNPHVLFQNKEGATIVFQMYDPEKESQYLSALEAWEQNPESEKPAKPWAGYPSNSPGFLVRRREEANWHIEEIDEEHPFIPVQNIVFPTYLPAGERLNLHSQCVVYPMNSTLRGITWELRNTGATEATLNDAWITTVNPGKITLRATIPSGLGIGTDYNQDIEVMVIENWIVIEDGGQPHLKNACIAGKIKEEISVNATTEFGELTYQWYKSIDGTNEYGTPISGAESNVFKIPKSLVPGDYYYFCEIRKVNFPSIRSDVAHVRVRDELMKLTIFPSSASIPPGSIQQFAVDRNPQTSDETIPTKWYTSDAIVVSIDENTGLATSRNPGNAVITAKVGTVEARVYVSSKFESVTDINWTLPNVIEANKQYNLPNTVVPNNATYHEIIWEVVDAGTTGASVSIDGVLTCYNVGSLTLRGVVRNGRMMGVDYEKTFGLTIEPGHNPVTDIALNSIGTPRVGDVVPLRGTVVPADASNRDITWRISEAGNTRASLTGGNLLTAENPGTVTVIATVKNGRTAKTDYTKTFTIDFRSAFIPVESIDGLPTSIEHWKGELGTKFELSVLPENATNKQIICRIENDTSGLAPTFTNNILRFDDKGMTSESEVSITFAIYVKNGLSDDVDFVTCGHVRIIPPLPETVRVPVIDTIWRLPSVLRAYRPIAIDQSSVVPNNATEKYMRWNIVKKNELNDCAAIIFTHDETNHADLVKNGVLFQEEFDWNLRGNYIYPMGAGDLSIALKIIDGLAVNSDWDQEKTLEILDPFIPVTDIKNIPTTVYSGGTYYLSPEVDSGDGMNEQTAVWDDRVPTFKDISYTLIKGGDLCELRADGTFLPKKTGQVQIRMTIESGLQEEYEWYGKTFESVPFVKSFIINIAKAEDRPKNKIIGLKLTDGRSVGVYTSSEYDQLRAIRPANSTITLPTFTMFGKPAGNITFKRSDVKEITFSDSFRYSDLSNFGRNFINLEKINKIPSSARNLRNFLMGCTKFNQSILIPSTITGDRCLEGFLRDCTSFNQTLYIPRVNGNKCLESFLRGCTKFNRPISLPSEIRGDCAMYSFMQGCTSFNNKIVLPKRIYGKRCMENVLRDCTSFNQPITMPEDITGHYNIAAFMFNCNSFNKYVVIPTEEFAEKAHNDVITMATFHRDSTIASNGVSIYGVGAATFQELVGNQGTDTLVPLRTLNLYGEEIPEPSEPDIPAIVSARVTNDIKYNEGSEEFNVGDPISYVISITNFSDEKRLSAIDLMDVLPENVQFANATTDKDLTLIKTFADDSTSDPIVIKAPVSDVHVHKFTSDYDYDEQGHWNACDCGVLSSKELHTPDHAATETEPSICSVCGYVIAHSVSGDDNGNDPSCYHYNTEIRNKVDPSMDTEGYSGDVYCQDCGALVRKGHVLPVVDSSIEGNSEQSSFSTREAETGTLELDPDCKKLTFRIGDLGVGECVNVTVNCGVVGTGVATNTVSATFQEIGEVENTADLTAVAEVTIADGGTEPTPPDNSGGSGDGSTDSGDDTAGGGDSTGSEETEPEAPTAPDNEDDTAPVIPDEGSDPERDEVPSGGGPITF